MRARDRMLLAKSLDKSLFVPQSRLEKHGSPDNMDLCSNGLDHQKAGVSHYPLAKWSLRVIGNFAVGPVLK